MKTRGLQKPHIAVSLWQPILQIYSLNLIPARLPETLTLKEHEEGKEWGAGGFNLLSKATMHTQLQRDWLKQDLVVDLDATILTGC